MSHYLVLNCGIPPFSDVDARKALLYAIDKRAIVQNLLGVGKVASSILPSDIVEWHYPACNEYYDPDRARTLLKESGWEDRDGDGILEKDGKVFEVTMLLSTQQTAMGPNRMIAEHLQEKLRSIGIRAIIQILEKGAYYARATSGKSHHILLGAYPFLGPHNVLYRSFHSQGDWNLRGNFYRSERMDALLELGKRTMDTQKRRMLYDEVQMLSCEDAVIVPMYESVLINATPRKCSRIQTSSLVCRQLGGHSCGIFSIGQGSRPRREAGMIRFIAKRCLLMVWVVIGVTWLVFAIVRYAPGDAATLIAMARYGGVDHVSEEEIEAIREKEALDAPVYVQYGKWLFRAFHGDLGRSLVDGKSVSLQIVQRFPATLQLALASMLVALVLAIPTGILSAGRPNSVLDHIGMSGAIFGVSMPNFWLGILLIMLFSVHLELLPVFGRGGLRHLVLPALTLGTGMAAPVDPSDQIQHAGRAESKLHSNSEGQRPSGMGRPMQACSQERLDTHCHHDRDAVRLSLGGRGRRRNRFRLAGDREVAGRCHIQPRFCNDTRMRPVYCRCLFFCEPLCRYLLRVARSENPLRKAAVTGMDAKNEKRRVACGFFPFQARSAFLG